MFFLIQKSSPSVDVLLGILLLKFKIAVLENCDSNNLDVILVYKVRTFGRSKLGNKKHKKQWLSVRFAVRASKN